MDTENDLKKRTRMEGGASRSWTPHRSRIHQRLNLTCDVKGELYPRCGVNHMPLYNAPGIGREVQLLICNTKKNISLPTTSGARVKTNVNGIATLEERKVFDWWREHWMWPHLRDKYKTIFQKGGWRVRKTVNKSLFNYFVYQFLRARHLVGIHPFWR